MEDLTLWDHALAIGVGLLFPLGAALQQRRGSREPEVLTTREKVAMYWGNSAFLAILAAGTLWVWCAPLGRPVAGLGLTPPVRLGVGLALGGVFTALYAADTWLQLSPGRIDATRRRWREQTPFMPATRRELAHSLVMVASAALFEEIVFRGYLIAYLGHFFGPVSGPGWLGGLAIVGLPALVFAAGHLYQGWHAVLKIALLAVLFGAIFLVTGSLWIPIALHFAMDLVGVLLSPLLLQP